MRIEYDDINYYRKENRKKYLHNFFVYTKLFYSVSLKSFFNLKSRRIGLKQALGGKLLMTLDKEYPIVGKVVVAVQSDPSYGLYYRVNTRTRRFRRFKNFYIN